MWYVTGSEKHRRFSATVTLRVIYGKTTPTYVDDPYIRHLQRMVPIVQGALMPGAYKVDTYPFLKYVPGYTRGLDKWADLEHEQFMNNVRQTKMGLVSDVLESPERNPTVIECPGKPHRPSFSRRWPLD